MIKKRTAAFSFTANEIAALKSSLREELDRYEVFQEAFNKAVEEHLEANKKMRALRDVLKKLDTY